MPNNAKTAQDAWNNNNLAHTDTWGFLFLFEELNVGFHEARDVAMSELAFFNPSVSSGMLEADAEELAARLDRAFRMKSRAKFETGWTVPKAVQAMKDTLRNKDKLVCELAVQVDETYNFSGEKMPA